MKVLLTGATGLVGKELGKKLVLAGYQLVVLARNPEKAKLELPYPAQIFPWDGLAGQPSPEALSGVEAVIHLAGESIASGRWSESRKKKIFDSRVLGTRSLVKAVQAAGSVKTFISASAIGIYGDRKDEVLTERNTHGNDYLAKVCEAWEEESQKVSPEIRSVHLRIGVVLSRHGGALEKLIPLFSLGLGGVIGNGQQWMSWIHVDDLVNMCELCLREENIRGAYNAVAPIPVLNKEFSQILAQSLGRSLFFPVPGVAMKIAMGEMSTIVLSSQHVDSQKMREAGFVFTYPTLNLALNEICRPLKNGHKELLAEQWVPESPESLFPFFCNEKNLEKLTPEFLNFRVLNKSTEAIQEGTLIEYRLKLHGIPLKWKSVIEKWNPGISFVDQQVTGPYKRWHHTHEFIPMSGGTLMRDRVSYSLPLGRMGDLFSGWKVLNDVRTIFAYRRKIIRNLFA